MALPLLAMLAMAGSVFAKDKIADWTEGTWAEKYTSQWDNPEWYDYTSAGLSPLIGGGATKIGKTAINIAEGVDKKKKTKKAQEEALMASKAVDLFNPQSGAYKSPTGNEYDSYLPITQSGGTFYA